MFGETQFRVLPTSVESVGQVAGPALWQTAGLSTTPLGPGALRAVGAADSYGVSPELTIQLQAGPQGANVQIRYGASVSQTSIVIFVILLLVFWPIAAVLGWLAYKEFTARRFTTFPLVWQALTPPALMAGGRP